jgi:type 1 glutamine amidotransferase
MMKKLHWILLTAAFVAGGYFLILTNTAQADRHEDTGKKKILFYSQSFGFRHGMVNRPLSGEMAPAEKVFKDIATEAGYEVHFSQDFHDLSRPEDYQRFDAITFYTSGNPPIHRPGLLQWLKQGGALIGIHSATDSFRHDIKREGVMTTHGWPEYTQIMGGAFSGHGPGHKKVTIKIEDPDHPATEMLGEEWVIADEIYQHSRISRDNIHVLMSIDKEKTNLEEQRMKPEGDYPLAWTNTYGKGRVFYAGLGHRHDVWTNPKYQKHLLGGIAWALNKAQ